MPVIVDGWHTGAIRWPIHAGRIGSAITPRVAVVHTTDMAPGTMPALLRAWATGRGVGAGAHFLLGKRPDTGGSVPTGGLVQTVPINRNGNHAGGPVHGWFLDATGKRWHPNSVAVGIELDNAGRLRRRGAGWAHPDTGRPVTEVYVDERGHGWERVPDYQLETLADLLDALALPGLGAGASVEPSGSYAANGVTWAALTDTRELGHVTLDPVNKLDPGPQVIAWLRARAVARGG